MAEVSVFRGSDPDGEKLAQKMLAEHKDSAVEVARADWVAWIIPDAYYTGSGFMARNGTENGKGFCDIATANHVIDGLNGTPYIKTSDGEWHASKILQQNPVTDVALLRIEGIQEPDKQCKVIPLSSQPLAEHERAVLLSANDGKWRSEHGSLYEYSTRGRLRIPSDGKLDMRQPMAWLSFPGGPGDSGAVVVNKAGLGVGITESGAWNGLDAIPAPYIQRALDETAKKK